MTRSDPGFAARIHAYENTPVWRGRAHSFIRSHGNYCDACGHAPAPGRGNVDTHHRSYANAFDGREPDSDLRALCRPDHELVHSLTRSRGGTLGLADATDLVLETRRVETRQGAILPRSYAYNPAVWDLYAKGAGRQVPRVNVRATPRRRRRDLRAKLAWFVAIVIWLTIAAMIYTGWHL